MTEVEDLEFTEEEPTLEQPTKKKNRRTVPKRNVTTYKSKIRHLRQYQNMTDEEFDAMFDKKVQGVVPDATWERRIQKKLDEFGEDYDLSDLKINDKYTLRALAAAVLHLEDYDSVIGQIKSAGIDDANMYRLNTLSKIQTDIRSDISKMQDDLKISRKTRRSEKQEDTISFIDDLKKKAKKYYEQKMMYIFCPKCNTLLATMWFLYPQFKSNVIKLQCHRDIGDGIVCDGEVHITSAWLLENGMRNKVNVPDSMK